MKSVHNFPKLIDLQIVADQRGSLGVIEAARHAGFTFQRFYFLTDIKDGAVRGSHAHKRLRQCIVALRGGVTIAISKGGVRTSYRLDAIGRALVLPPGYWRDLYDFTSDALVGVLASEAYDEDDYIRNYDAFTEWEQARLSSLEIPYLDLKRYHDQLGPQMEQAIARVLRSGWYIGGEAVAQFEKEFSHYCEAQATVGVANGLDALVLSLRAKGIGSGDQVILPANTFVATALAVSQVGAEPVLADIDPASGLMDIAATASAVSSRTKAIIPVHLYGHPADMDPLISIAQRHDLFLLEDAAQAHGARYKGRACGSLGDAAAFSFYPTKNLGALGDAGAVTAADPLFIDAVRNLGNYGSTIKYRHDVAGSNSRLDPLQAAVLSLKLKYLTAWNERRKHLANRYMMGLADIADIRLPQVQSWAEPVWHVFSIRVSAECRDRLREALSKRGIGTNIHYPIPIHLQPCYSAQGWLSGMFPESERASVESLSLPLDPLHRDDEIDLVIEAVREFFGSAFRHPQKNSAKTNSEAST